MIKSKHAETYSTKKKKESYADATCNWENYRKDFLFNFVFV